MVFAGMRNRLQKPTARSKKSPIATIKNGSDTSIVASSSIDDEHSLREEIQVSIRAYDYNNNEEDDLEEKMIPFGHTESGIIIGDGKIILDGELLACWSKNHPPILKENMYEVNATVEQSHAKSFGGFLCCSSD